VQVTARRRLLRQRGFRTRSSWPRLIGYGQQCGDDADEASRPGGGPGPLTCPRGRGPNRHRRLPPQPVAGGDPGACPGSPRRHHRSAQRGSTGAAAAHPAPRPARLPLDELTALAATRSLRPTNLEVSTPAGRRGPAPVPPPHAGREPGQCLPADSVTTRLLSNRPRKEGRRCATSSQQAPTRCSQPGPTPGAEP
jgi:hypothetical protein